MNGAHDLGGQNGLGAINPEPEATEPVFHAEWERRVFALTLAAGMLGKWNIDEARYARERQHPVTYLSNSYYENWLAGLELLLQEKKLLETSANSGLQIPTPTAAAKFLAKGGPTLMQSAKPARFKVGEKVRVKRCYTNFHTRVPRYAQGAVGIIAATRGSHIFADEHSKQHRIAEHLYSVRFQEQALWNRSHDNVDVLIDLWEPYLDCGQ